MYTYNAKLIKFVDGDTIDVKIDIGFNIEITECFRFVRINAPEIRGSETILGNISKNFVMAWFKENTNFIIKTEKDDSFGRYIYDVYSLQNECLND